MPKNNVASTRLVASHALPAAEMTAPVLTRNKTHGPVDHSPRFVTCIPLVQRFVLCLLIGFLISVPAVNTFGQSEGPQRPNPYRPSFTPINNGSSATTGPTSDTTNPNAAAAPQNNSAPATAGNPAGAKSANPTPTPPSAQPGSAGPPTPSSTPLASRSTELSDGTANSAPATGQWQQQRGTMPPGTTTTISTEITKVSKTFGALPNESGQVWREYDILPYTSQITNSDRPQQAIIDWILRHTGKDMWFAQPLGILNATREKLIVYHTPEVHNEILRLVDRFIYTHGQRNTTILNVVTVSNPDWRESVYNFLQPIEISSPGVEAWLVSKENAALLYNQLSRRSDFKNVSSGTITLHNGQQTVLEKRTPAQFVRSVRWTPGMAPGFQPLMTQMDEGYTLSISFLDSLDGRTVETAINCEVDQIEKLTGIRIPVPGIGNNGGTFGMNAAGEKMNLQIPQIVSWRLQERIRWPVNEVLLVSCGVVAVPNAEKGRSLATILDNRSSRADALLFIDFRGAENPRTAQVAPVNSNLQALPPK